MRNNVLFERAVTRLSHPVSLAAVLILLINACVFQPNFPSWLTGKIGDFAWLVFVPFVSSAFLGIIFRKLDEPQAETIGYIAILLTGITFVAVKCFPEVNRLIQITISSSLGFSPKLSFDPTDLIALPGLFICAWIWQKLDPFTISGNFKPVFFGLAILAIVADAPAPQNLGIVCLKDQNTHLLALREWTTSGYAGQKPVWDAYSSQDGGLTWIYAGNASASTPSPAPGKSPTAFDDVKLISESCPSRTSTWTFSDSEDPKIQFLFLAERGVYKTVDGGENFQKEIALGPGDKVYDAVALANHQMVLAVGKRGVLVFHADIGWKWVEFNSMIHQ